MKSQAVIISAYLASILVILILMFYYINVFPYSTTINVKSYTKDVYTIIYSKVTWSAKELAYTLISKLDAKYAYVNITTVDLVSRQVLRTDTYRIASVEQVNLIYKYIISRLDDTGEYHIYYIEVGF